MDKKGINAAADRMREMNDDLSDWDRIRQEGERISREEGYKVMAAEIATLHAEIERLRLTDAERDVIVWCLGWCEGLHAKNHATLRGLLERLT